MIDELPPEPDSPDPQQIQSAPVSDINATLNALEAQKQKLLAELQDMEGSMASSTPATQSNSDLASYDITGDDPPPVFNLEEGEVEQESQGASYQSMSYLVSTPIIQHSGISKLPSYDKFSDGITDHLPFENLPTSTGVYDKMSGVLKGVKEKMAEIRPKRKFKK